MDPMQSKINELEKIIKYAKENKLLKVEMGDIKVELHPSAFQTETKSDDIKDPLDRLSLEDAEVVKKKLQHEADEILFWSAFN